MKLQQLKAFVKVLEEGSFSKAALELDISQSTLSYTINELERELGETLFKRGRLGAEPTSVGEAIACHARMILRHENAIFQEVSLSRDALEGRLRVAAFRSAASEIVPMVTSKLKHTFPELHVELVEMERTKEDMMAALQQGKCDIALAQVSVHDQGDGDALYWEVLREPYVAVLPKAALNSLEHAKHVSAFADASADYKPQTPDMTWQELVTFAPILHAGNQCGEWIRQRLEELGITVPEIRYMRNDFTSMQYAARGLGVNVLPRLAAQPLSDDLMRVEIVPPLYRIIVVMILPSGLKFPAIRLFLQTLRRQFPDSTIPAFAVRSSQAEGVEN